MPIQSQMSDKAVMAEIGARLGRRRVELELTQADLAREAGVSKRSVERVEAGESAQFSTMIRILRVLAWLDALDTALPASGPRPMELLKLKGKERRRVSSKRCRERPGAEWTWGDES